MFVEATVTAPTSGEGKEQSLPLTAVLQRDQDLCLLTRFLGEDFCQADP